MTAAIYQTKKSVVTNWMCSSCAEDASCNCGAPLMSKAQRAAEAISRGSSKSDRAIAKEIGVGSNTVRRAREATAPCGAVDETRTGLDGKQRKMPSRSAAAIDEIDYGHEENPYKPIDAMLFNLDLAMGLAREAASYRGLVNSEVMKLANENLSAWQDLVDELKTKEVEEKEYTPAPYKKRTKTDVVIEDLEFALGLFADASRYSGPVPKRLIELADQNAAAWQQLAIKWQAG
jgi:hypothetical protein